MTRERISFTFDPRYMLLSPQMGFSFVRAAFARSILERISGLKLSSETTAPRYSMFISVPSFCHFTFISLLMPLALFISILVLTALISILYLVHVLSRLSTRLLAPAFPQLDYLCHRKPRFGHVSAACANLSIMFFQSVRYDPFEKNVEEGW